MARRAVAVTGARALPWAAACAVALMVLGPLVVVMLTAEGSGALSARDWAAVRFTMTQAVLSALFSVALAVPVARALARRRFAGRRVLIMLLGAPFVLPVIVAVLGLLAVFGNAGLLNGLLAFLGLPQVSVYGLHGVVLAHVFFNLPLAVRLILQGWAEVPAERFRLAASLGMGPGPVFRHLEWPMLRAILPGALVIVFLICLTSFAVALTLGGGPRATTVELAIYQAFRFEFDLARAARLAVVQTGLTVAGAALALAVARPSGLGPGLDRAVRRWDGDRPAARLADGVWIAAAALFLLTPMAMIAAGGAAGLLALEGPVFSAAARSLGVALAAVVLAFLMAVPLAFGAVRYRALEGVGFLPVAASSLVLGAGLFLIVFPIADPGRVALPVTAAVNALMALPFVLRILLPALQGVEADYRRLATSLGMEGTAWLRLVVLPRLRAPVGFAAGLTAALAMGDLGVIALFADPGGATLPLQVFRLMGAYQMEAAQGAAFLLLILSLGLFWAFDRGGRGHA
ncbi:thiamine/thiamine pyrophosphate ABC transporter permease ThiP [Ovoidimarina sediminis]|uniref:thiamine/thiamine pyrophosphate ABC transporter permease ThiP n=1 Tax=Ovoidimarina sediminis TaxID=3079856 RepID=UPI00290B75A9|nr:thiamine/thiamine pyrophosphate ABC transporter permease ThiP [Rhodophyticola sp. MJ-SS7]MDU8942336.1 thiamine/thiamine pyrophosphate ABC transporter permease ThiP [Rhodophyticola sp. MJ-SS7]